jgi:anthranilate phosphoribosyltransferase
MKNSHQELSQLSIAEFREIFNKILSPNIDKSEIKEFLINLNQANLPLNSFIAASQVLKEKMVKINIPFEAIDVCGTGGDNLKTLNISTAVAIIIAAGGVKIAKHGNRSVSSISGSADIFDEMKIKFSDQPEQIINQLEEKNLAFIFAPFFHPILKNIASVRKEIAAEFHSPTIFNFLGPLINPCLVNRQIIGVSNFSVMEKIAQVIAEENNPKKRVFIVHGFDKMDEITLTDNSYLMEVQGSEIKEMKIINPEDYGFKKVDISELVGRDAKFNCQKLINLLSGEKSAYREIVLLNSAFAFFLCNKSKNIEEGIKLAEKIIADGLAKRFLLNYQSSQ